MTRLLRVGLALALCFIAVGIVTVPPALADVGASDGTGAQEEHEGPTYSSPDSSEVTGEGYEQVSLDLGAAVEADAQQLHAEHDRRVFAARLDAADSTAEREQVAEQRLATIQQRYERLAAREDVLLNDYGSRELNDQLFLRELVGLRAAIEAQATLQDQVTTVEPAPDRMLNYEATLMADQPVTETVRTGIRSADSDPAVYIQTGEATVILATVDKSGINGGTYTRQAIRQDGRNLSVGTEADQFRVDGELGVALAFDRAAELYTWEFDNFVQQGQEIQQGKVYGIRVEHTRGLLRTYLDGATTDVFHEIQTQPLRSVEFTSRVVNSTSEVNVNVERTRETGPMRITVTEAGNLDPIDDVTVQMNGNTVGTTDDDGELWLVQPRVTPTVTVTTPDGETVMIDV